MKILGIETSCDETAVAVIEVDEGETPVFNVLSHALYSQVAKHAEFGGVHPNLARREHQSNLVPLLDQALKDAKLSTAGMTDAPDDLATLLEREPELFEALSGILPKLSKPDIDMISVTVGPGLEPALWVGLNFARALSRVWGIPLVPANHMEGHIVSVLQGHKDNVTFPAIALLVSGGHTELVLIKSWGEYEKIGQTLDDAAGEAFDKVARMLELPYPGGPEISKLAEKDRGERDTADRFGLPRPMVQSDDFNFSYSGLKTAVLYKVKELGEVTDQDKQELAREFEDAVTESLLVKTEKAVTEYGAETLILAGGVIANTHIRKTFQDTFRGIEVLLPESSLATDNAVMIAIAGYIKRDTATTDVSDLRALGNLSL